MEVAALLSCAGAAAGEAVELLLMSDDGLAAVAELLWAALSLEVEPTLLELVWLVTGVDCVASAAAVPAAPAPAAAELLTSELVVEEAGAAWSLLIAVLPVELLEEPLALQVSAMERTSET